MFVQLLSHGQSSNSITPKTLILDCALSDPSLNLRSLSLASKTTNQDYFGNFKRTRMSYKRWITKARGICGIKSWWNILLNSFWICKSNNMEIRYFGLEFYILTVYWGEKRLCLLDWNKKMHIYKKTDIIWTEFCPSKSHFFFPLHKIGHAQMIFLCEIA